ncbi:MAG: hypothetical protein A3K25_10715 [Planctomycetes bacterium RIFOXYB12_FULL_42_10]|nr:MAG: hypothetical protein A3K25_10715 [Planctomycetes bacterium RIFOXYB12_FULL_42_10]
MKPVLVKTGNGDSQQKTQAPLIVRLSLRRELRRTLTTKSPFVKPGELKRYNLMQNSFMPFTAGSILQIEPDVSNRAIVIELLSAMKNAKCLGSIVND